MNDDIKMQQIREGLARGKYILSYLPVDNSFGEAYHANRKGFYRMAAWFEGEDDDSDGRRNLVGCVREKNYDGSGGVELRLSVPTDFLIGMRLDYDGLPRPFTVYLEPREEGLRELRAYFSKRAPRLNRMPERAQVALSTSTC